MTFPNEPSQLEITKAWVLWNALHEHAETLWDRYEPSFVLLIQRECQLDQECPDISQTFDFEDDDIPF